IRQALDLQNEPELALRADRLRAPRLRPAAGPAPDFGGTAPPRFSTDGTVLITGGTGELGAAVARHLGRAHCVRHLLLVSRRGSGASSARALQDELCALGADVRIQAADLASERALVEVLGSIPPEHPLCAVIHCAGVLADAT